MLDRRFYLFGTLMFSMSLFVSAQADENKRQILMLAGPPSHGYGAHEHYAGLKVLEESIGEVASDCEIKLLRGWPEDESVLDAADTIVIYCDGGKRHIAMKHRDKLRKKLADGCGLVCLHYAIEMLPDESGDDWVDLLGGHFEVNYSVNPHWVASFEALPEHSITTGVEPFSADDEWYFHLRFKENAKITPILAAVAPPETMRRPNGHHSGNPHVRKSVAAKEMQTVAWAYDREDGGRSFGFSGGHNHWNWGRDDFRRLVVNAILWSAKAEVPGETATLDPVGMPELIKNQDYDQPKKFDAESTAKEYELTASSIN